MVGSSSLHSACALWPVFPQPLYVCWWVVGIHPEATLHFRQAGIWTLGLRIIRTTHTCRINCGRWFFLGTRCPGLTQACYRVELREIKCFHFQTPCLKKRKRWFYCEKHFTILQAMRRDCASTSSVTHNVIHLHPNSFFFSESYLCHFRINLLKCSP